MLVELLFALHDHMKKEQKEEKGFTCYECQHVKILDDRIVGVMCNNDNANPKLVPKQPENKPGCNDWPRDFSSYSIKECKGFKKKGGQMTVKDAEDKMGETLLTIQDEFQDHPVWGPEAGKQLKEILKRRNNERQDD